MQDAEKARIALAEAILEALWVNGLVTLEERNQINLKNRESLLDSSNC